MAHITDLPGSDVTGLAADLAAGLAVNTEFSSRYASLPLAATAVQFVAANGSDANDGLSWGKAKATINGAVAALPAGGGLIQVGAGTFAACTLNKADVVVQGVGPTTIITSAASGSTTVCTMSADRCILRDLKLYVAPGAWTGNLVDLTADDARFERVSFDGSAATSNYDFSIDGTGADRCTVHGCVFLLRNGVTNRGWTAMDMTSGADLDVAHCRFDGGRNCHVDVRSITNASLRARITDCYSTASTSHAFLVWNSYARVSDNTIHNSGSAAIFVTGDPESGGGGTTNRGAVITGNTIYSPTGVGINVEYDVHDFVIAGNSVYTPGGNGISLIRTITDGVVSGNVVDGGSAHGIAVLVFGGAATSARLSITGNVCRGNAGPGLRLQDGANSVVDGNVFVANAYGFAHDATYATGLIFGGSNLITGSTSDDYSGHPGVSNFNTMGFAVRTQAGAVSDANYPFSTPPNGALAVDSTGSRLYVRIGGAWKSVVLA